MLRGEKPGEKIGRITSGPAEIARLCRELDVTEWRLATAGVALEIMAKMPELLENRSKRAWDETPHAIP